MSLQPGSRLAQYELTAPLGSGGMGDVYRARDLRLGRDVAIKVMAEHIAADPQMRQRFETEARAVAAMSHPSIMAIHELGVVDGRPFAVMELLEGVTLRKRIESGALPWREAASIAAAVADGLAAAHAKEIVHRDLKPENIFLTGDGVVKVLDFGLALHRTSLANPGDAVTTMRTLPGVVLGTFGYMSPEQVLGQPVDSRSDIFALGCVLYEMLAGRLLFEGPTPQDVLAAVIRPSSADVSAVDAVAPPDLRTIIVKCIEKERSRRFGTAGEVALALRALVSGTGERVGTRRARPRGKSLAVLPFANTGADPRIEYLTDGITESIINSLSQLPSLRVVPRSLVFRYKGLQADPAAVGLALSARIILTGHVVQQGEMLNIQAELVDTATESQLWGQRFQQKTADLMAVQEEIAWQISEALRLRLSGEQKKRLRRRPTVHPDAYQEYLRGRHEWHNWGVESFQRAVTHFERAIDLDPSYALAFAGLGSALGALSYYGVINPNEGFPRSHAAAQRALEIDDRLADAHVVMGLDRLFHGWDWRAAETSLKRALELDPDLSLAHAIYSLFLNSSGRFDEALAEARRARALDPLSPFISMGVAWVHHFAGRASEAVRELQDVLALRPGLEEAGNVLITSYESLGKFEEATALMAKQRCWGIWLDGPALLAAYRAGGAEAYWRARLEMMRTGDPPVFSSFAFAVAHCRLGEFDLAMDHLDRMVAHHLGGVVFMGVDSAMARMRGLPRFETLLRRIGAPRLQTA